MRNFSKSKLISLRQCPKKLWLELNRPDLLEHSAATEARLQAGHDVGEIARQIYDPTMQGETIDIQRDGFEYAFSHTKTLLQGKAPIFEAGFAAGGALAFADVLLPVKSGRKKAWRMVEVKSSTGVKDYHLDDVAVQAYVATAAGVPLQSVALAHIDSSWVYPGNNDYQGLLTEVDLTEQACSRTEEVRGWVEEAQAIYRKRKEPQRRVGEHCYQPFECGFYQYCSRDEPQATYPVQWLPRIGGKKIRELAEQDIIEMQDVADDLLNEKQLRVKKHTLNNKVYFDAKGAAADLAPYGFPAYFLDFETIQFAIPIWQGTRPYQQIPFQFSLHVMDKHGNLSHSEFLDLSGNDPSHDFAMALVKQCGTKGPVYVYNAAFEKSRISELAERYPKLSKPLLAINERVVDLYPIAGNRYYHPSQQGSWSIKKVLPAIAPELRYDQLDGVQDGGMAMDAFLEAIHLETPVDRKTYIHQSLQAYCKLDTFAMVKLWEFFKG